MHNDGEVTILKMLGIMPAVYFNRFGLIGMLAMGGCRIRIPAIGTNQAIDHRFQGGRSLVPMDGRYDHDAVSGNPKRIDFIHPVIGLAQRIIRVATAWPMA